MMKTHCCQTVVALVFVCLLFNSAAAQTFLFQSLPKDRPQVGCRYLHPYFDSPGLDITGISGVFDLYGNIPLTPKINLIGSVPFMTMNYETPWAKDEKSDIGNIDIGMQYRLQAADNKSSNLAFGVLIPTASDKVDKLQLSLLSILTNNYELQKYLPDMVTLHGNIAYHTIGPTGGIFGIEVGPYIFIPTEDDGDSEMFMHYGLSGGARLHNLAIFGELLGRAIVTEGDMDFGDRFDHVLTVGLQWLPGPGVFYKLYLDEDYRDVVDGVLGIKLELGL